jgi:hypothetical protein
VPLEGGGRSPAAADGAYLEIEEVRPVYKRCYPAHQEACNHKTAETR